MAEREFHLRTDDYGMSYLVYSSISTRYSGYFAGWHAVADTTGFVTHKVYCDGTYEEVNQTMSSNYDPISGRTIRGKDPLDAVRRYFTDEHFNKYLTGNVNFKLEFKTPSGKHREVYARSEGLGITIDSVESALEYGRQLAKRNKWSEPTWVPSPQQCNPYNQDTLRGDKFWHPAAVERARARGIDAPDLEPLRGTGKADYFMTYENAKGRTKTFDFSNGDKHKGILVSDAASAAEYAKAKADDWGVRLVGVEANPELASALTDLMTSGLEK